MMNKKGLSFGRLMLYILFITILGFIIYSLVLTYKEIKKKEPTTQTTSKIEVGSRFAYNNDFDYSAADYFSNYYYCFYNNNDALLSAYTDLSYDLTSFVSNQTYPNFNFYAFNDNGNLVNTTPNYYNYYITLKNDNVVSIGDCLRNSFNDMIYQSDDLGQNNYIDFYESYNCVSLVFNIDCPIQYFNFSISGNYTGHPTMFFVDNMNYMYKYQFYSGSAYGRSFNATNNITFNSNLSTKITKLVFFLYQGSNSSSLDYYNFTQNYGSSYILNNLSTINFDLTFDVLSHDASYQSGYEQGYQDGKLDADFDLVAYNNQLVNENIALNGRVDSLTSRINQQTNIINQLQYELDNSQNNFKGLFFTMADIPFKTVHSALGFDFWGVNLFEFFVGVLTALGIIWLIKKIL